MAFPTGWLRQCPVVIQHGQVPADQTAFPVLISEVSLPSEMLTSGGGNAAQSDGGDIRFSTDSAGASQIACEVVLWTQNANPALSKAEIWVPINILTASDVTIYVWYNAGGGLTQPAAGTTFGSQAVWDSNFKAVYHLADGSSLSLADSTASGITGTNHSTTATAGQIDGAASFVAASSQYQDYGTGSTLSPAAMTFSAWIKATSFPNAYNSVVSRELSGGAAGDYTFLVKSSGKIAIYIRDTANVDMHYDGTGTKTLSTGTWYHVVLSYAASGSLIGYVNGSVDATVAATALGLNAGSARSFLIGNSAYISRFWNGVIDEIHVSNSARSANWILTEYNNQSSPSTFVIAGTPGSPSGGGSFLAAWTQGCNKVIGGGYVS